jgi:hypothetical protein
MICGIPNPFDSMAATVAVSFSSSDEGLRFNRSQTASQSRLPAAFSESKVLPAWLLKLNSGGRGDGVRSGILT